MTSERQLHKQLDELIIVTTDELNRRDGFRSSWRPFAPSVRVKHNGPEEAVVRHIPRTNLWLSTDARLYRMVSRRMGAPDFFLWRSDEATPEEIEHIANGLARMRC